ncbi:MAG: NAD(P)-dependent oxidoreductase [Rhizobiaceae bacterium]|jgi:2-hydroxy-3-oxopropionate reductase|nr:NAD(P)-dependent oxidoreductase [Rhizobiaceae bacterium]
MRISFLGLGLMGGPMAGRLIASGHDLTVWNRDTAKMQPLADMGATLAATPAGAVAGAEAVITMLTDGAAVRSVLDSMAESLQPGTLFIDMSSIAPAQARRHADLLAVRGVQALDAPVSGGTAGARDGTLAIMVGGEASAFEAAHPVFAPLGRAIRVGGAGAGQVAKLCNQQIVAITIGAVAEALHLAERAGADPAAMRAAIRGGFAESRILELHGARMLARDFTPGGRSSIQLKDLDNILKLAGEANAATPLSTMMRERYATLVQAMGQGELDHSAILLELEAQSAGLSPNRT